MELMQWSKKAMRVATFGGYVETALHPVEGGTRGKIICHEQPSLVLWISPTENAAAGEGPHTAFDFASPPTLDFSTGSTTGWAPNHK